jgi:alanyl-tRNA synthetase
VLDVKEICGEVFHVTDAPLAPGAKVTGEIDWPRRFDHMQQHSGEHILSGILCAMFSCDNVGFHMGEDAVTIDYSADISWEQAQEAQRLANEAVWADRAAEVTYPAPAELDKLDYRSKKALTGQVRIVTFPGADCCACCGTHVLRAGQAGPIHILSAQKLRGGTRFEIVCGGRALALLHNAWTQNRAVGQALSVKAEDTAAAVERTLAELTAAHSRIVELEDAAFAAAGEAHAGEGDTLLIEKPLRSDGARRLADAVARRCGGLAAVFAGADGEKYNYALVRADGAEIAPLVKALNAALHGRGGGRNGFAQGSVQARRDEIEAFFAKR